MSVWLNVGRTGVWIGLLLAIALVGCDSGGADTIVLQPKEVTFEFPTFDQNDVDNGEVRLNATAGDYLANALRADGFSKDEVVSAEVSRVELARRSLGSAQHVEAAKVFDFLVNAELHLTGSGGPITIANKSSFDPSQARTEMNLVNREVTPLVTSSSPFGARLDFTVSDVGSESFRVAVVVTFRIEVEGV